MKHFLSPAHIRIHFLFAVRVNWNFLCLIFFFPHFLFFLSPSNINRKENLDLTNKDLHHTQQNTIFKVKDAWNIVMLYYYFEFILLFIWTTVRYFGSTGCVYVAERLRYGFECWTAGVARRWLQNHTRPQFLRTTAELKTINVPNRRNKRGLSLYTVMGDQIRSEHGSGRI